MGPPRLSKHVLLRASKKLRFKIGLVIVVVMVAMAILAPYIAPYPDEGLGRVPLDGEGRRLLPPNPQHLLGTDTLGRDLLSRIMFAARAALMQSTIVIALSLVIGLVVGSFAAYFKGLVESALTYLTELFMAVPSLVIALFIRLATNTPGYHVVIVSLTLTWWAWYARISYVYAKGVVELDYVVLAKLAGLHPLKIVGRHILRVIFQPMAVQAISDLGSALLEASAINFMGLGLPRDYPDWGVILFEGLRELSATAFIRAPWLVVFPGLFILITTLGFALLADPLREELDPRLSRRWRLWF
jgi:peptide/nickel transport system permease protein